MEAGVDFLAVVEHRLIPARVRSAWARLRGRDWPPSGHLLVRVPSHVGNAGVWGYY